MIGFLETIVEYYTGRDASALNDKALAMKIAHIHRIRKLEARDQVQEVLEKLYR